MEALLDKLDGDEVIVLAVILCVAVITISVVAMAEWRKHLRSEMEAALKRDLLDRGMSADEIVQVISATSSRPPKCSPRTGRLREAADYQH